MNKELLYKRRTIFDEDSYGNDSAAGGIHPLSDYDDMDYGVQQNPIISMMNPFVDEETIPSAKPKRIRKLKTSASVSDALSAQDWQPTLPNSNPNHSAMLDNGDLSHESLKAVRDRILCYSCCPSCSAFVNELDCVEGVGNVFSCQKCNSICGLDDSINVYDLISKLGGENYTVEPCLKCGNTDANFFSVDFIGDSGSEAVVSCMNCAQYSQAHALNDSIPMEVNSAGVGSMESENFDEPFFSMIECKCENDCGDIRAMENEKGDVVGYKCHTCKSVIKIQRMKCSCSGSAEHDIVYDKFGYVDKIICLVCEAEQSCEARTATPSSESACDPVGRTRIESLLMLKRGDHIAWYQFLSYWHHAIVTRVDETGGLIRVIHYNGPNRHKGTVVEEDMPIDLTQTKNLYRIDYRDSDCYHPDEVVKRARTRLGETEYRLFTNNCEHFACWSKTNKKRSNQSRSFVRTVSSHLYNGVLYPSVKWLASYGSSSGGGWSLFKHGSRALSVSADVSGSLPAGTVATINSAANDVTAKELTGVAAGVKHLPGAYMVLHEVRLVYRDISDAHQQRVQGHISREEFVKVVIRRTCEGAGSAAAIAIAVAIPVTRNAGGMTLASLIGKGVGCFIGRQLSNAYIERSSQPSVHPGR